MLKAFYKSLLFTLTLSVVVPFSLSAQVSQIVFTTEPQTIKPGQISEPLTIQTQDSSGVLFKITETVDLEFLSTSPTGEFLGSTGNPATKTMSNGSANRTFYYRDSAEGTFTITVKATGRVSGTKWSATQPITISNTQVEPVTENPTPPSSSLSTPSAPISSSSPSSHYGATPLSGKKEQLKFEVGAGRARVGAIGMPMEFKADVSTDYTRNVVAKWSFGDGSTAEGTEVVHVYNYPGEYVVVLNVTAPEGKAVARTNVKIIPADLSVTFASPERVEVTNNSRSEINLYGRALVSGPQSFLFPQDTIIGAGQRVSFGSGLTGINASQTASAAIIVVGEFTNQNASAKVEEVRLGQIVKLESEIFAAQSLLVHLSTPVPAAHVPVSASAQPPHSTPNSSPSSPPTTPLSSPISPSSSPTSPLPSPISPLNPLEPQTAAALQAATSTGSKTARILSTLKRFFLWQK